MEMKPEDLIGKIIFMEIKGAGNVLGKVIETDGDNLVIYIEDEMEWNERFNPVFGMATERQKEGKAAYNIIEFISDDVIILD